MFSAIRHTKYKDVTLFLWLIPFINIINYYLSSILPVYIIHQSIIVVAGFYFSKYVDNGFLELLLIVLVTVTGSLLAYNFIKIFRIKWSYLA